MPEVDAIFAEDTRNTLAFSAPHVWRVLCMHLQHPLGPVECLQGARRIYFSALVFPHPHCSAAIPSTRWGEEPTLASELLPSQEQAGQHILRRLREGQYLAQSDPEFSVLLQTICVYLLFEGSLFLWLWGDIFGDNNCPMAYLPHFLPQFEVAGIGLGRRNPGAFGPGLCRAAHLAG